MNIIIIGAGFGGLFAAKMLENSAAQITIIEKQNYHLFQPLLYQVATGLLSAENITVTIREEFRQYSNITVIMDEVSRICDDKQTVITQSGKELSYDYLILATGSVYNYFGHTEWQHYAPCLKTIDDALEIRRRMLTAFEQAELLDDKAKRQEKLRFIIIGGGPTGVEMAGAIADIATRLIEQFHHLQKDDITVIIIEAGPALLSAFPKDLSAYTHQILAQKGVTLLLDSAVIDIIENTVILENQRLNAGLILWSAGIKVTAPMFNTPVATDNKGRIKVTANLSLPGIASIFVVGDAAYYEQCGQPLPQLASVAKQQGKYVGKLLKRSMDGRASLPGFHYHDWGMLATIGRNAAVMHMRFLTLKGWSGFIFWGFVHILLLTGFRNRITVFFNWCTAYFAHKPAAQIIISPQESLQE
jgi:NADH dehydrogenase FAD-containing subunit